MQLIIFKAPSGSDPPSERVVGHPYVEEERPEDGEDVHLFEIWFFLSPRISNGKEIVAWVMKKSRCKSLCPFTLPWDFSAIFPFHDVSRCFRGNSNLFFFFFVAFYPTEINKATGDLSWSQKQRRREKWSAVVWVTKSPVLLSGLFICLPYHRV